MSYTGFHDDLTMKSRNIPGPTKNADFTGKNDDVSTKSDAFKKNDDLYDT